MAKVSAADVVTIQKGDDCSCAIHMFGATVISWKYKGEEMIFVSSESLYDKKKAIRGGVPVVFPNFGPWELGPQHGFARSTMWTPNGTSADADGNPSAVFMLEDNEETRKMWDFPFRLTYRVTLKDDCLDMDLVVHNTGTEAFDFTCLLHTYFRVPDVAKSSVLGLKGVTYIDKVENTTAVEERDEVVVEENVDRVYQNSPPEQQITNAAGGHVVSVQKRNLPDTVVWNPWQEKAAAMSDFGDDEYPMMLCVEAGFVSQRKTLVKGEKFEAAQRLSVLPNKL